MSLQYLNSNTMRIGPIPTVKLSYDAAWLYCACLTEDGYSDWRMPTSIEADSTGSIWIDTDIRWNGLYANCVYTVTPVRDC